MRILGIDPGTVRIGWGVVEIYRNNFKAIAFGLLKIKQRSKSEVFNQVIELVKKFKPDQLALEKIYFAKNEKTALEVAKTTGVIILAAEKMAVDIKELTPLEVKKIISGYGRADKKAVGKMVKLLLNLKVLPQPDDVIDALAIALAAGL